LDPDEDVDLDPDADPDPALFVRDLQNNFVSQSFYAYSFLKVYLHHSSTIKCHKKRSHKTVGIKVFLHFLLVDGRIWILIRRRIR
jgi:hypothetical protein